MSDVDGKSSITPPMVKGFFIAVIGMNAFQPDFIWKVFICNPLGDHHRKRLVKGVRRISIDHLRLEYVQELLVHEYKSLLEVVIGLLCRRIWLLPAPNSSLER